MKRMKRSITAANDSGDSKLMELTGGLKDDFDFILSGFEKLDRIGATESNEGLMIAEELSDAMQSAIAQISAVLQEVE